MSKKTKNWLIVIVVILVFGIIVNNSEENVEKKEENTKVENNNDETKENEIQENDIEKDKQQVAENDDTTEPEQPKELTESEYKANCNEVYNADVFKNEIPVGQLVKVRVMASEKYKYGRTDMWGIITEDITEKYSLERNSLGCTVMHESTKNDSVPSYFGEQMYVMFQQGGALNIDTFKTGQKFTLYGEVIQNKNGTFVLLKYYEAEE